jgi:thioredoxin-related protein
MKKVLPIAAFLAAAALIYAFALRPTSSHAQTGGDLKWYTWDEAVAASKKNPKKIMVDVYTDWCGWCKRMDATTFQDDNVKEYLAKNFYPVKLDAEQKEDIEFNGHTFKFQPSGRRGAHELAISLLSGRMSYPSIVYLSESFEIITVAPGYKTAEVIMKDLRFVGDNIYKTKTWDQYLNE